MGLLEFAPQFGHDFSLGKYLDFDHVFDALGEQSHHSAFTIQCYTNSCRGLFLLSSINSDK